MSTYSDIRDAIVARMRSVTGVANVHGRQRYAENWSEYLDLFKSGSGESAVIHGWIVTWENMTNAWGEGSSFGSVAEKYVFQVEGMYGLDDAADSETTFLGLVEEVKNAIRDRTAFGVANVIDYSVTVTIPQLSVEMAGNVMCHYARLRVEVDVKASITFG